MLIPIRTHIYGAAYFSRVELLKAFVGQRIFKNILSNMIFN